MDSTIQALDLQVQTINKQILAKQNLKAAYADRIAFAKGMENALRNGDSGNQIIYYNQLQDWAKTWLGQTPVYKTVGSGVSLNDANIWNGVWNDYINKDIPDIDAAIGVLNTQLADVNKQKADYYASLTPIQQNEITNQSALDKIAAEAAADKARSDAAKSKADSDAALLKLQMQEQDQTYAQSKSKMVTYAGIFVGVLLFIGIAYVAFFAKTKPKPE